MEPMEDVIQYIASQAPPSEQARILNLKNIGLSANDIHHLCKGPSVTPRPHPSSDFISLFRLNTVATSVRRIDPLTGEKINKLRKSYEGKIKELTPRLPGRNKAVSKPGEWHPNLMNVPDEDWINTNVRGKMPESIVPSSDFQAKLAKALSMAPGKLPTERDAHYRNIIALDDSISVPSLAAKQQQQQQGLGPGLPAGKLSQGQSRISPPSPAIQNGNKLHRPERSGAKRRYMDSSFVGYGDGYGDDDMNGDAAGDEDARNKFKKRRKESYSASSAAGATTPMTMGISAGGGSSSSAGGGLGSSSGLR